MGNRGKVKVGGIMVSTGLATVSVLSLPDRPEIVGIVLQALGKRSVNIEFIVHNLDLEGNGNMTFRLNQMDMRAALGVMESIKPSIDARGISYHPDDALISVFGPHFRERPMISV